MLSVNTSFLKASLLVSVALVATNLCPLGYGQNARPAAGKAPSRGSENAVARGKYIVEGVARCGQCHTPRDAAGRPDESHRLEGAPVWLKPAQPVADWPLEAPRIAGNPPGTDAEMVKLLTTGIWRDGRFLRPPMPQFRMRRQDAESVVAYLKSLKPEPN
jgi:mono/diheme cytochrome c family protein